MKKSEIQINFYVLFLINSMHQLIFYIIIIKNRKNMGVFEGVFEGVGEGYVLE